MKRLQFQVLEFDKKFIEWVKYKNGGDDPKPVLDSIRDEFANHHIVEKPPFAFDHKGAGSYIVQVPTRPTLFLFTSAKANGRLKVYGGLFHDGRMKIRDDMPFASEAPIVPVDHGGDERNKIIRYLLAQSEASEIEEDREVIERLIHDIRERKHHRKEEANGQQGT